MKLGSVEHEERKKELRARLETERRVAAQTVTSFQEIEVQNAAYWANVAVVALLRLQYMKEAEEARKRWPWDEKSLIQQVEQIMKDDSE